MPALPPLVDPADPLSADELRRYSRHLLIPEIGVIGQRRLKAARVLVVGAGGLGSPALTYLAAAGVGTLGVIDPDSVDESNLQRQIVHGVADLGRPKVESARDRIRQVNPLVEVVTHPERLESSNALGILGGYDLVIDGSDNFATRYLVNDACVLLDKPLVWGSVYRFDGQASVFWAAHGPCYRCLYPDPPPAGMVPSCAEGGVLGVLCAAIGSIQGTEAIKLITGVGEPLVGRLMVHDALAMAYLSVPVGKDPQCPVCGAHPTITELIDYDEFCGIPLAAGSSTHGAASSLSAAPGSSAAAAPREPATITAPQLAEMLDERAAGQREFLLVDVREPVEAEILAIPGAILIPQGRILSGEALDELPRNLPIVLHCRTGARSARVLARLTDAGFTDVVHLAGGVLAWVNEIEPHQPTP